MTAHAGPSLTSYGTPPQLVRALARELARGPFHLDVCAEAWSSKGLRYLGLDKGDDGLTAPWSAFNFCNPPYDDQEPWIRRALHERDERGAVTVCVVREAAEATYWIDLVACRTTFDHFVGRLEYIAPPGGVTLGKKVKRFVPGGRPIPGSNFASAVIVYAPGYAPGVVRWRDAASGELLDITEWRRAADALKGAAA